MYLPLVEEAANIRDGTNPSYAAKDFLIWYPQFNGLIPDVVLNSFIDLGNAVVKETRYKGQWKLCIGLFIAHMCALWLKSSAEDGASAAEVIDAAAVNGVITSESADGVSYSMDTSALQDLNGWAQFKLTGYGVQFASIAKLMGKGGMYVW